MNISSVSDFINCSKGTKLSNQKNTTEQTTLPQRPQKFKTRIDLQKYLEKVHSYYKSKDIKNNDACKNQIIKLKKSDEAHMNFFDIPPSRLVAEQNNPLLLEQVKETVKWAGASIFKILLALSGMNRFKNPPY